MELVCSFCNLLQKDNVKVICIFVNDPLTVDNSGSILSSVIVAYTSKFRAHAMVLLKIVYN